LNLTNHDVQEILRLLEASAFDELHLETDQFKLTLRRTGAGWTQEQERGAGRGNRENSAVKGPPRSGGLDAPSAPAIPPHEAASFPGFPARHLIEIRPPIVGTFYRAPKPGAPPFVEVGSRVDPQTIVAIIETMKLMNSLHAGASGEVVEICALDGELVQTDRVVMRLRGADATSKP
jgi:acetyl-CoA carboxylase biotin carboxyl carrier protein